MSKNQKNILLLLGLIMSFHQLFISLFELVVLTKPFSMQFHLRIWVNLPLDKDKGICSEYGECVIPFYESTFLILGFRFPLNKFKIEVFNHLMVAPCICTLQVGHILKSKGKTFSIPFVPPFQSATQFYDPGAWICFD